MMISKPKRKKFSYTQRLCAGVDKVFPLLCPVREIDWVSGWAPKAVYTYSGVAEKGCVFLMEDAVWAVSEYEPFTRIGFHKFTPDHTLCRVEIVLSGSPGGALADVSYEYTAIGTEGEKFVDGLTEAWYETFMKGWEKALNHYIQTGGKLEG